MIDKLIEYYEQELSLAKMSIHNPFYDRKEIYNNAVNRMFGAELLAQVLGVNPVATAKLHLEYSLQLQEICRK